MTKTQYDIADQLRRTAQAHWKITSKTTDWAIHADRTERADASIELAELLDPRGE